MLPKKERIKYNGLFQQAYQKGKRLSSGNIRINFTKTRDHLKHKLPLMGFVVSKNFSKKAVIRNLVKRKLREIYRLYRQESQNAVKLQSIGLLVISIKGNFEDDKSENFNYQKLKTDLEKLLDQMLESHS